MQKIIHVCVSSPYVDGLGYQENILACKHKELGYDVKVVTSAENSPLGGTFTDVNGITVVQLPYIKKFWHKIPIMGFFFKKTHELYKTLNEQNPDILFVHGIASIENVDIIKYCSKNKGVRIFADSHSDYYNTAINSVIEKIKVLVAGRVAKRIASYCKKVWGVSPWRVDFLKQVYHLPSEKVDLLVMGGDEKYIDWKHRDCIRKEIRQKYQIPEESFLVITGGRIDKTKNIHLLVEACKTLQKQNVYLMLFGKVQADMEDYFNNIHDVTNIINIGWIESNAVYPLFLASDLGVFPGTHSVLWEQACAAGLPCLFKDWGGGFSHVDVGGNCMFIKEPTMESLKTTIESVLMDTSFYSKMRSVAEEKARKVFSYIEIAKQSIQSE